MVVSKNLQKIKEKTLSSERVLDLGGGRHALPYATHVVDLEPFESHLRLDPISEDQPRFNKDTWIVHDACDGPLPFKDKFFDFCFCSHLLEDVRDPINICREMIRVAKAGYIEVPSRQREIFAKARLFKLRTLLGRMPEIGFYHHRWFVEAEGDRMIFTAKDGRLYLDSGRFITRFTLGRKLTEEESATYLFWENSFSYEEAFMENASALNRYRDHALRDLRG